MEDERIDVVGLPPVQVHLPKRIANIMRRPMQLDRVGFHRASFFKMLYYRCSCNIGSLFVFEGSSCRHWRVTHHVVYKCKYVRVRGISISYNNSTESNLAQMINWSRQHLLVICNIQIEWRVSLVTVLKGSTDSDSALTKSSWEKECLQFGLLLSHYY